MSSKQRLLLLKTLTFLFFLNAISFFLYYLLTNSSHHSQTLSDLPLSKPQTLTQFQPEDVPQSKKPQTLLHPNQNQTLKPWPRLPSLLPWTPDPKPPPRSCEAYFGNGFSERIQVLRPKSGRSGSFLRCHYSETLRSSIWEMGRVRMDPGRIWMSKGGEELESVIGRTEEEELPKFQAGAFEIEGDVVATGGKAVGEDVLMRYVPKAEVLDHTMHALLDSVHVIEPGKLECSKWVEEPTILVTRFEYANVFHTVTDWYSAYVSSRVTDLPYRPHLIFVDGHCKTQLEETWEALFSSVRYAKSFSGPICFRHAILSPLGYETALFKGLSEPILCQGTLAYVLRDNPDDQKTSRLSEFGEMIRAAFDLLDLPTKPSSGHNVLFVRREDYLAHPRHNGKVESRLSNEQEIFDTIKNWAADHMKCKVNVINGLFAHMPLKEQLRAIHGASVVVGAHGAGLTHLVAASPDTKVIEIISSFYQRPHFALISQWKGLEYHAINLAESYAVPSVVIEELESVMSSLNC